MPPSFYVVGIGGGRRTTQSEGVELEYPLHGRFWMISVPALIFQAWGQPQSPVQEGSVDAVLELVSTVSHKT